MKKRTDWQQNLSKRFYFKPTMPVDHEVPWQIWHPFIVIFVAIILALIPSSFSEWGMSEINISFLSMLLQDACFFLLPLFIVCGYYKCSPQLLGMRRLPVGKCLLVGIPAGVLLYLLNVAISIIINLLFPGKMAESQQTINLFSITHNSFETVMLVAIFCILAPIAEEVIFRAFLYPPAKKIFGRKGGIICAGVVFSFLHMNIWTFLPLLAGGIGFAYLYDRYGNLWINVVAHSVWNSIVIILYFVL